MTRRALSLIAASAFILLLALTTRGALFWLLFWIMALMLLYAAAATFWTASTLSVKCALDKDRAVRGSNVALGIRLRHSCPLPVDDIRLSVSIGGNGDESQTLSIAARPFSRREYRQSIYCPHVGEFPAGATSARVGDVFGLFSVRRKTATREASLIVQPRIYPVDSLPFSPGDSDDERASRAFEDATMPTDLRAYQQGDELKKVHWKLSMRRRELIVRVYEQPMRPDALLLVDCAPPGGEAHDAPFVRDAICEAAVSVASVALSEGAPVRMPLLTEIPVDVNAQKAEDIIAVSDALGRCAFDGTQQFERVLLLETRRLRRTGTTAIITSRMNPIIADMILRIRRMGPKVRVMLAMDIEREETAPLVQRLMRGDVEVVEVTVR